MIRKLHSKSLWAALVFFTGSWLFGQVQFNMLDDWGTPVMDINSQGEGILMNGYYDFATNTPSITESNVYGTSAINDSSTIVGLVDDGNGNMVAGIRVGGVWSAFPSSVPIDNEATLYDISENGIWVVGQTGWDANTDTAWGFIYNTDTEEFRLLESPLYEYSAAYGVNNNGVAVGWVDDLPSGTFRMPAIFMPDGSIFVIDEVYGDAGSINNDGLVVGAMEGYAFIYDMNTDELEMFEAPDGAFSASFASISQNGIVVGFASYPGFLRMPIIYHPDLGNEPQMLSDILNGFGIDTSELSGTGYKISADGNYVSGFTDGPAFMAIGWAVYFDNMLIDNNSGEECQWTVNVWENYFGDEVEWELRDENGTVLLSGGPYGLEYNDTQTVNASGPLTFWITNDGIYGDNQPNYSVSNENGVILSGRMPNGGDTRTFDNLNCEDTPPPPPNLTCDDNKVEASSIENGYFLTNGLAFDAIAGENGFDIYGLKLNVFVEAESDLEFFVTIYDSNAGRPGNILESGFANTIEYNLVGNEFGYDVYQYLVAFDAPFTLDANSVYWIQAESTGVAWQTTSSEIIGSKLAINDGNGWSIDEEELIYELICEELGVKDLNSYEFGYYPNPVNDILTINTQKTIQSIDAFNLAGQKVISKKSLNNKQIDMSNLAPGTYVFKVVLDGNQVETFKIIKK